MTYLPNSTDFAKNTATHASVRNALIQMLDYLNENDLYRKPIIFDTKALMTVSALPNDTYAIVMNDEVTEFNGFYQKIAGAWVFLAWNPFAQFIKYINEIIINNDENRFSVTDEDGFSIFTVIDDTIKLNELIAKKIKSELLTLGNTDILDGSGITLVDKDGFSYDFIKAVDDLKKAPIVVESEKSVISALESEIASKMQLYRKPYNHATTRIKKGLNIILVYGQSLAVADRAQTWVTRTPSVRGNLMLGESPRGSHNTKGLGAETSTFGAKGGNVYHPLQERGQYGTYGELWNNVGDGGRDAPAWGETICSGMLEQIKELHNLDAGYEDDTVVFATSAIGANGATIEELAKGNTEFNIYNRYLTCIDGHMQAALAAGYTDIQIVALVYIQGESNSGEAQGVYLPKLQAMKNNMVSDAKAATGQTKDPAFFVHQIGGNHAATNGTNLATAMAELEICKLDKNVWQIGSHAGYPNPTDHLFANSYRWWGCKIGNAMYNVLKGRYQTVFKALKAVHDRDKIYISFLTPTPPLTFKQIFNTENVYQYVANNGFEVKANNAVFAIKSVEIVSDNVICLTLNTEINGNVEIFIGGNNTDNNHNIFDSNQEVAVFDWKYYGDKGQSVGENIAALNDKILSLSNQSAIQYIKAEQA